MRKSHDDHPNREDDAPRHGSGRAWLAEMLSTLFAGFGNSVLGGLEQGSHVPTDHKRYAMRDDIILYANGLVLRPAQLSDHAEWRTLRENSHNHLTQWEPAWRLHQIERKAFARRIRSDRYQSRAGRRFAFLIFRENDNALLGGINLSDVRFGNRRSGTVGYWVGQEFARQGIASAAMTVLKDFAFDRLNLQRIEAACQPGNIASRKLLQASGFSYEGLARGYLRINGAWRDHEIWACIHPSGAAQ